MKYCNPDTCSECLYIGEGDSICEISHELVLDNWQSAPTLPEDRLRPHTPRKNCRTYAGE